MDNTTKAAVIVGGAALIYAIWKGSAVVDMLNNVGGNLGNKLFDAMHPNAYRQNAATSEEIAAKKAMVAWAVQRGMIRTTALALVANWKLGEPDPTVYIPSGWNYQMYPLSQPGKLVSGVARG